MALKSWSTTDADNDDADLSNNIRWTENQAPSTVNNSARAMMTQIKRWWNEIDGGTISNATVGGTADVITLTTDQGVAAYAANQRYVFTAGGTNTTNVTVNVDSLGAKAVNSHGDPLAAGAIVSGDEVMIIHDGTDFELVYPRRQSSVPFELVDDSADATFGPQISLYRNSASPAASDNIGYIDFAGENSAGTKEVYARIQCVIVDPTSTSEDGAFNFLTDIAGTRAIRAVIQSGLYMSGATGSDKGAGTINASSLYEDGTAVSDKYFTRDPDYDSGEQTVSTDTTLTLAHSLGAIPRMVEVILRCKTTSDGYTAGQEVIFNNHVGGLSDQGVTVSRDATNVVVVQGGVISVINPSTNNNDDISTTNWRWVIRAWT